MLKNFKTAMSLLLVAIVLFVPLVASAANVNLLSGQKQYYTVQMREDKKSLVYAKITFENPSETDELKTFTFTFPDKVQPVNVGVQQILAKNVSASCKTYETFDQYVARVGGYTLYEYQQNRKCLEQLKETVYDDDFDFDKSMSSTTDYYYYNYYLNRDGKYEYRDLTPQVDGQKYTVTLPQSIKPKKQGAILVSYITNSYITGSMGRFHYDFQTFTADQLVTKAVVAINFDDELYSRLPKTSRQASTENGATVAQGAAMDAGSSYSSKSIDDVQTSVGQGGRYVETKSQLLPGEVFSVKGTFATSRFKLFLPQFLWTLFIVLALAVAAFFAVRRYRHKHPATLKAVAVDLQPDDQSPALERAMGTLSIKRLVFIDLVTYGATILAGIVIFCIVLLAFSGGGVTYYGYFNAMFVIVVFTLSMIAMLSIFIGLPLLYVSQFGRKVVLKWAVVRLVILIAVLFTLACSAALIRSTNSDGYDGPISSPTMMID